MAPGSDQPERGHDEDRREDAGAHRPAPTASATGSQPPSKDGGRLPRPACPTRGAVESGQHIQAPHHRHGAAHSEPEQHPCLTRRTDPRQAGPRGARSEVGRDLGARRHPPVRSRRRARGRPRHRLQHRHPAADRIRQPAHRARLQLHAHGSRRAVPADARQAPLLPDGLGRQRAADRAPRAELLRRALRPDAPVRRRFTCRRSRVATTPVEQGRRPGADLAPQLHRALREADRRRREAVRGALRATSASASTGRSPTAPSAPRRSSRRSARSCATWRAARRTRPTRRRCGT